MASNTRTHEPSALYQALLMERYDAEVLLGGREGARTWMLTLPDEDFQAVIRGLNMRLHASLTEVVNGSRV